MATYTNQAATKDNYINKFATTANYGAAPELMINAHNTPSRILLEFDLSDCPVGTRSAAVLSLLPYSLDDNVQGLGCTMYRLRPKEWLEGTGGSFPGVTGNSCWNNYRTSPYPPASAWLIAGATGANDIDTAITVTANIPAAGTWMDFTGANMLALVEDAIANRMNILRVMIKADTETGTTLRRAFFRSRHYGTVAERPKIVITYTTAAFGVTTLAPLTVRSTRARLQGRVTGDGGNTVDYYGFVYKTGAAASNPGNVDPTTNPNGYTGWKSAQGDYGQVGDNPFGHEFTGLKSVTTYRYRACARTSAGWLYGDEVTFTTEYPVKIIYDTDEGSDPDSCGTILNALSDLGECEIIAYCGYHNLVYTAQCIEAHLNTWGRYFVPIGINKSTSDNSWLGLFGGANLAAYFSNILRKSTLTNGTGVFTGSPVQLADGNNTITCTTLGTAIIRLADGARGTAISGDNALVVGSPKALVPGDNTITVTGATGTFTVNVVAYEDAVTLMRRALMGQPDKSVTYVMTGPLKNLKNVYDSAANYGGDGIPYTGAQLLASKVKELVLFGGDYPIGIGESNMICDAPVSQVMNSIAELGIRVIWTGVGLGAEFKYDVAAAADYSYVKSAVRYANMGTSNTAWEAVMGLYVVRGRSWGDTIYIGEMSPEGKNVIDANGNNSWVDGPYNQWYLTGHGIPVAAMKAIVDAIMSSAPSIPLQRQVAASTDDLDVYKASDVTWTAYGTSRTQLFVGSTTTYGVYKSGGGMRFLNVTIPRGSRILAARLVGKAWSSANGTIVNSRIVGNLEPNAATFSTLANYQSRRGTHCGGANDNLRTVASVCWDAIPAWTEGIWYYSPDISPIIQEIIDQPGWVSGNALALFWDDHEGRSTVGTEAQQRFRRFCTYDQTGNVSGPILQIVYQQGNIVQMLFVGS